MDRHSGVIRIGPGRPLLVLADSPAHESDRTDGASVDRDAGPDAEPGIDPDGGPAVEPGDAAEASPPATGRR